MEYIKRELERKFLAMNAVFKAVMVTGARQVGKSTMLKKLAAGENRTYVNLDNSSQEIANWPKVILGCFSRPTSLRF